MNRCMTLTAVLLSGCALGAFAQATSSSSASSAEAGPTKIAVVAFQTAVTQTNEFQRDFADLQKKYEPKRQELKTLNDQIDELKKQLQTQGDTLSDVERERRTRTINDKEKQLQRTQEDDQNNFQQDMQQTFNSVANKVGGTMIAYAQQHSFTLVLDAGNPQSQVVLYASTGTDITKSVIDAYNVKSGVPAPAQSASSTSKPAASHAPAQHPAVHK